MYAAEAVEEAGLPIVGGVDEAVVEDAAGDEGSDVQKNFGRELPIERFVVALLYSLGHVARHPTGLTLSLIS